MDNRTPKTDAEEFPLEHHNGEVEMVVNADFARSLETRCGELEDALDNLQACASSIRYAHGNSFKNSLKLDLDGAIRNARKFLKEKA